MTAFVSATARIRGDYRYRLTRVWDEALPMVTFVLLNPSTADAATLDPTLRRCIHFANRDGFGGLVIVNLYAFRARHPRVTKVAADPVGPDNDQVLAGLTGTVVAGWGNHAAPARVAEARPLESPKRSSSCRRFMRSLSTRAASRGTRSTSSAMRRS